MGATLESLLALQGIELQIVDIRRQLAAKERAVKRQAAKLRSAEEALEEQRDTLKRSQMDMDAVDVDVKARSASVASLREKLNAVKTNKEYAAVLSQLNTEKADVTRLEARAMEMLEEVEAKKKAVGEQEETVKQEKARLQNVQAMLEQSKGSFASRLEELQQERDQATEKLDRKALTLFERLSERYEGEVIAKVVQPHPRRQEFICDGCNMSLSAEVPNSLLTRDDVITCQSCGRILYFDKNG